MSARTTCLFALAMLLPGTRGAHAAEVTLASGLASVSSPMRALRPVSSVAVDPFAGGHWTLQLRAGGSSAASVSGLWRPHRALRLGAGFDYLSARAEGQASPLVAADGPRLGYHVVTGFTWAMGLEAGLDFEARLVEAQRRPGDGGPSRFASRFWTAQLGVRFAI